MRKHCIRQVHESHYRVLQKVELKATRIVHVGACDNSAGNYPLSKKKQTFEFLREKAHLRPRTNTIGAVARIRNALASATHEFFQSKGFILVHTPLITTSDCEGAGEMFQVFLRYLHVGFLFLQSVNSIFSDVGYHTAEQG